jgi:hypothetical protein
MKNQEFYNSLWINWLRKSSISERLVRNFAMEASRWHYLQLLVNLNITKSGEATHMCLLMWGNTKNTNFLRNILAKIVESKSHQIFRTNFQSSTYVGERKTSEMSFHGSQLTNLAGGIFYKPAAWVSSRKERGKKRVSKGTPPDWKILRDTTNHMQCIFLFGFSF